MLGKLPKMKVTDAVARRKRVSFAFVSFGLILSFAWMVLTALIGQPEVSLIGAASFASFALVRLLKDRLPLLWVNTVWLTSSNLAIFLGACLVHPSGRLDMMLIPMAGFPFTVFSIYRERFHVAALAGLPVVLWATWFVLEGQTPVLIGEAMATRLYAPMSVLTAFSCIVYPVFYYASVSARYSIAIKGARRDAEQSSRAKTMFLSGISHEMRTPLNAVIGLADLLQDDAEKSGNATQAEYASRIMEAGETLLATVEKTVHFADVAARRTPVTLACVNVSEVITHVFEQYQEEAARSKITLRVEDCAVKILADFALFEDALAQLVENAVRYCGAGCTVWIRVVSDRAGYHRVVVADDGPGFGTTDPALAFAPFERLTRAAGTTFGAGLGLAIARIKAEAMAGSVGIDFDVPNGAQVWIELPAFVDAVLP